MTIAGDAARSDGRQPRFAVDLVVLDFDGTLVDSRQDIAAAVNAALTDLGQPRRDLEEVSRFIGRGLSTLLASSLPEGRQDLAPEMPERFRHHYDDLCEETTRLYPGVAEGLQRLHTRGKLLAIASNKSSRYLNRLLRRFGVAPFFWRVLGEEEMARRKPDPWCVQELLAGCRLLPRRALMAGDMRYDMETGVHAGVRACGAAWGYGSAEELRLAGAEMLADSFAELESLID